MDVLLVVITTAPATSVSSALALIEPLCNETIAHKLLLQLHWPITPPSRNLFEFQNTSFTTTANSSLLSEMGAPEVAI